MPILHDFPCKESLIDCTLVPVQNFHKAAKTTTRDAILGLEYFLIHQQVYHEPNPWSFWPSEDSWACRTAGRDVPLLLLVAERIQFEQLRIPEVLRRAPKKNPITWEEISPQAGTREVIHTIASFSMLAKSWVSFSRLARSSTRVFWKVSSLVSLVMENRNKFDTLMCRSTGLLPSPSAKLPLGRSKHPRWTTWGSFVLRYVREQVNSWTRLNWTWV